MNSDILKGNWKEMKGKIKETWGDLTDDEIKKVDGNYESLVGTIQKKYGETKERAEESINSFLKKMKEDKPRDERRP